MDQEIYIYFSVYQCTKLLLYYQMKYLDVGDMKNSNKPLVANGGNCKGVDCASDNFNNYKFCNFPIMTLKISYQHDMTLFHS